MKSNFLGHGIVRSSWAELSCRLATLFVAILFLAFPVLAGAQTVTVQPSGYITAPLGGTVQFSATVTGASNQNVTWSIPANGKRSSAYGSITSTGLYTAPTTMPSGGNVEVLATSQANSSATGMQFVYLLQPGPTISGVTPNPLPTGTVNVTISGSGFQANGFVDYSYNGSPIQTSELTQSASAVTASIYIPSNATNVTFTVSNPGSAPSNAITVPVGAGPPLYTLTVTNGTITNGSSSGSYAAGAVVPITANAPPAGSAFVNWTGNPVANPTSASTTITMPAANAAVTANFSNNNTTYLLTVINGSGGGTYAAGAVANINANAPPAGQVFKNWTGATVANPNSPSTTLTMPASATSVTANYQASGGPNITAVAPNPLNTGSFEVVLTGTGFQQNCVIDYNYNNGSSIQVAYDSQSATTLTAAIYIPSNATTASFWVFNPGGTKSNVYVVTVNSGPPQYTLTVNHGSNSGLYTAGTVVPITANAPPQGQIFVGWSGSPVANPNAASTTITMPAANAAVTANYAVPTPQQLNVVNGTANGASSGTYLPGTVVTIVSNPPPTGDLFLNWTGATVANATSATTTLTMPNATTTVTANYQVAAQVPYPVSAHPRLWLTPADVPRLRSWAVSSNPVYTYLNNLIGICDGIYQSSFFPGGVANANWPDPGDTDGYQGPLTEEVAYVLAFGSLIDPDPTNRIKYAQEARNLIMYVMNIAAKGPLVGAPFRDPQFPTFNRASWVGSQWPLVVDWIYNATDAQGNAILTATDKATVRSVFMLWAQECCVAYNEAGFSAYPTGAQNNANLLLNGGRAPMRMASNNYYLAHMRLVTLMGLAIDPSDDPVVDPTQAPATFGNTLRSYILDGIGGWLYQVYAMMGDPATVAADFGLPGNGAGFGLSSGGLPPEGMLYGESYGYLLSDLLALQTAGFNSQSLSGPQIKMIGAPVWDRFVKGYLSSLTPEAQVPPTEAYSGPVFQMASYGDILRLWITPDDIRPLALLALLEQEQGQSTHVDAARWFATNVVQGTLAYNVQEPWTWGTADSILSFLLLDPNASPAIDPRPSYPLNFFDPAAGRVLARSDWSPNATWFDYRASWESIYHQDGDSGQFEFFRKGEWLTKEMSNYDNNGVGLTTFYHNTLALKNWCANGTPVINGFEDGEWANGSNWMLGESAGDPTTVNSFGPGYNYVSSNLTNLFNRPSNSQGNSLMDITQATRSAIWLNNDYIVVYDRATSIHSGLFKTFNLNMATSPQINGNVATETMGDGQHLYVQALLPLNVSMTSAFTAGNLNPHTELDPMYYTLTDQDPSMPADTRFLHVLQGADSGVQMVPATYVTSASGTSFDGAQFGSVAVFFPVRTSDPIATTTFTVSSSVHTLFVVGLAPGASYGIATSSSPSGTTITLTVGGTGSVADSAGLLKVAI